jgi:hypothetical protein
LLIATEESCDLHDEVFEMETKRLGCVRRASTVVGVSVHARSSKTKLSAGNTTIIPHRFGFTVIPRLMSDPANEFFD